LRILFLTQLFEPEPALKGVAFVKALEAAGHKVQVVTGFPNYPGGKVYPGYRLKPWQNELLDGVQVTRLLHWPSHNMSGVSRAWHFFSFFLSAFVYVLVRGRRFDLIYVGHPGVTTGLAALLGGRLWHLPYVLDIQDLWPDSLMASGLRGATRFAKTVRPLCDLVHHRAAFVVAQSQGMAKVLIERGADKAKVKVIYNWAADAPTGKLVDRRQPDGPFPFIYAGNMGPLQALHVAVEAAGIAARGNPRVELWLVGSGVELDRLKNMVKQHDIKNVKFLPRVPARELPAILSKAGALLLCLADKPLLEFTIPSKSQFYLAAGMPVLAAVGGEVGRIMQESGAAIVVPPENPRQLADAMLSLAEMSQAHLLKMGDNGRRFYDSYFSFEAALTKTNDVLNSPGL
jgi:colanic acid biosynthesis glycosyl transferase WcaI